MIPRLISGLIDGWISPEWPAPAKVRAVATTRAGPALVGEARFAGFNLGGDDAQRVGVHRERLFATLQLAESPLWLRQVHGKRVLQLPLDSLTVPIEADAVWTQTSGVVCAVQTADCLPILLCDTAGSCVAAIHAGWRGLAAGVIEATVAALPARPRTLMVWLGPAIGPAAFEVGEDVRSAFVTENSAAAAAFAPLPAKGKYLADLYSLARNRLHRLGVEQIFGGNRCTFREPESFYSFRRDGATGRQASLIWLTPGG